MTKSEKRPISFFFEKKVDACEVGYDDEVKSVCACVFLWERDMGVT